MPSTRPSQALDDPGSKLDEALEETFPASDPPSATSFTPPAPADLAANSALGEPLKAYVVISQDMSEKKPEQWRCHRNGRWVSANVPVVVASMSPAGALLECLVKHDCGSDGDRWLLATLSFPCTGMRRLDNPHDGWRERPYRGDVRCHGDQWAIEHQSLALRVPSAVCPGEFNVLLNTAHPEFCCVKLEQVQSLDIDSRL